MPTNEFQSTSDWITQVKRRKRILMDKTVLLTAQQATFDCEQCSDCPLCVLQTELRILNEYLDCLEREVFYISKGEYDERFK